MNGFVGACRREWDRLGVAAHIADEMAHELGRDLADAEADGATLEEVVGSDTDPGSFAHAWAAARGVLPVGTATSRRSRVAAAIAVLALVAAIMGAVLVVQGRDDKRPRSPAAVTLALAAPSASPRARAAVVTSQMWIARADSLVTGTTTRLPDQQSGDDTDMLGVVLLIVGLTVLAPLTLYWSCTSWRRLRHVSLDR